MRRGSWVLAVVVGGLTCSWSWAAPPARDWKLPLAVKTLANGLTVVVSEDRASPTFGISVVYRTGFRLEPKGRTGFAHLFEHMMFQGTPNAPKGALDRVIEGGGGVNNGSTTPDYTNYIASAPVSALDPILWLEADRMKGLDLSPENLKNQQEVVKEEVRVNVKNRPYGAFFWTDLAGKAFDRWENAHDGYGSFEDLDAATLEDVKRFFENYYVPNNTVIGIAGDVSAAEVFAKVETYFGAIPMRPLPAAADFAEPPNRAERSLEQSDALARVPAVAVGFKLPPRSSRDYAAATVLGDLLAAGDASRLYQGLVKGKELLIEVSGGAAWPWPSEGAWHVSGPALLTLFGLYKPSAAGRAVVDAIQEEIARVASQGVPAPELARVKTKMRSDYFANLEAFINRADGIAVQHLLTGRAEEVNEIPARIEGVTSEEVRRVAATYLVPANRTWIDRKAAAAEKAGGAQ
jgi:predicted Zn-dependent peptidase